MCKSMSIMGGWRAYVLPIIENKKLEIKLFLGLLFMTGYDPSNAREQRAYSGANGS